MTSTVLKLRPLIVTVEPPAVAPFGGVWDVATGASNVTTADDVPTKPLTVTADRMLAPDPPAPKPQLTVVAEVHDVLAHAADIRTDAVTSTVLKLRPLIVTVEPPEVAPFASVWDVATGASNVKAVDDVPTTPVIVTADRMLAPDPTKPQATVVGEVHDVVVHSAEIRTDGETSTVLKFEPLIVTVEPPAPAVAPFVGMWDVATGASNVKGKSADDVPTKPLTVTAGRMLAPDPPAPKPQLRVVGDVHDVLAHVA